MRILITLLFLTATASADPHAEMAAALAAQADLRPAVVTLPTRAAAPQHAAAPSAVKRGIDPRMAADASARAADQAQAQNASQAMVHQAQAAAAAAAGQAQSQAAKQRAMHPHSSPHTGR